MFRLTTFILKLPRNTEITPEAAQTFLATLTQINSLSFWKKLAGYQAHPLALEIVYVNQQIRFQITCANELAAYVQTQIQSAYPLVIIEKVPDPLEGKQLLITNLKLKHGNFYPLATFANFTDIDPLSSVLSVLSKASPDETILLQFALEAAGSSWQRAGDT